MSVTEVKQSLGDWSLTLRKDTPRSVLDALTYLGHIAIVPGKLNVAEYGDNLLIVARYVGVYRDRDATDVYDIGGSGMAFWLGDEDGKGDVLETAVTFTGASFATVVAGLLPPGGAITAGTISAVAGTYSGKHQWQTPRDAITYVTDTFGSPSAPVEWRVTNDGKLDAGLVSAMYVTTPRAILVRRKSGRDLNRVAYPGVMSLSKVATDLTTRVVLLAEGEGDSIATGSADAVGVAYKDIHGNTAKLTRLSSEADTSAGNATARAQLLLNRFTSPTSAVDLSASAYDIKSDFVVGDYIDVYDPDNGFVDPTREVPWMGEILNPVSIRCVEMTWPIVAGWTVAFRDYNGVWIDLSSWYEPESGDTSIKVGDLPSALTGAGGSVDLRPSIGSDSTVPGVPVFNTPFSTAVYQSEAINEIRSAIYMTWSQPLNTDSSTILDGDHYEIRYRTTNTFSYAVRWDQVATLHWDQVGTWDRPLSSPLVTANDWQTLYVPWSQNSAMLNELAVAAEYEIQIRAVDNANPPNAGAWSASVFTTTQGDIIAPSTPAAPSVASSLIAVQITHTLGKASGGTFNLENDLDHLEVHAGGGPDFLVDSSTILGRLVANSGNLIGLIPVVGTFAVSSTDSIYVKVVAVDAYGNRSSPSAAVAASATLIDSAHISDLTASKITAGTITSDILVAGSIATAPSGQRVEINSMGLQVFDDNGELTINLTADDDSPNFMTFGSTDSALASISSTGDISGQDISANDFILSGQSFTDDIIPFIPLGVVAEGIRTTGTTTSTGPEIGVFEVSFIADSTRNYRIASSCWLAPVTAAGCTAVLQVRDGGDSAPTIASSPVISRFSHGFTVNSTGESFGGSVVTTFTDGLHRLLFSFLRQVGSGNVINTPTSSQPNLLTIEDVGPATVVDTSVDNDGGGGSGGTPAPVTNYTKSYTSTWSQTYDGGSSQKSGDTADQGDYTSDSVGNRRSLIGFNTGQIMSDLSGATIKSVTIRLYAEHWYFNDGGTAVIGTHNYTSRPGSWSASHVNDNRVQSGGWPRAASRTVSIGSGIGNEFKSGTTRGIALGPGPSSALVYYGKFSGAASSTTSHRPVLTISYTK